MYVNASMVNDTIRLLPYAYIQPGGGDDDMVSSWLLLSSAMLKCCRP